MTVRRFPRNTVGRDYAASDLHGEFDELTRALETVGFDPARDRLFLGGDLVDRGSKSLAALDWLRRPGVHSLLGNHEEMFLTLYADGEPSGLSVYLNTRHHGRHWWRDIGEDVRAEFLAAWRALPLAFEIETADGPVGMVHAEVPPGWTWPTFCAFLEQGDPDVRHSALWGRKRHEWADQREVAGLRALLVGHQPHKAPTALGNVVFIDTGLVYGKPYFAPTSGRLTVVEIGLSNAEMVAGVPPRDEFLDLRTVPR